MTERRPPGLAIWLFSRISSDGPHTESLLGDFDERFRRGRSSLWYWKQIAWALLVWVVADIRFHKALTLRGVIIGWVVLMMLAPRYLFQASILGDWLFVTGIVDIRRWWPNPFVLWTVMVCILGLTTGWIVGRWNRVSTVVAFVGLRMLFDVPFWWYPDLVARITQGHWLYEPHLQVPVVTVLLPISILIGGLLTTNGPPRRLSMV